MHPKRFILYQNVKNRRHSLEGYHGTRPSSVKSILKTKSFTVSQFIIGKDFNIQSNQSLPNDLGQGLYLFIDDEVAGYSGLESAKNYARIYRSNSNKIGVISFEVDSRELKVLDLSEPESKKFFNLYKQQTYNQIKCMLGRFRQNRSFKRFNLDGIFLEHILQYHPLFQKMNAVTYESYVPTVPEYPRPLSGVENSREFCLRDMNLIDWTKTKEVYHGF